MGIQFFGEFLIDRWVITRGQLLEALELQEYRNSRFGDLAVQNGLLSKEQVQQINEGQRSQDMRFGDLAMQMGLLDDAQVRQVLTLQKNNYLYLGESLLELGHVTDDILERELAIFEEEQARFAQESVPVPEGVLGADLVAASADLTRKMMQAAAELCGGKLLLTHEGGYNTWTAPFYGLAVMEELSGIKTATDDPFLAMAAALGGQDLQPHQLAEIEAAVELLDKLAK